MQKFPFLDALSNGFGERFLRVRSVGVLLSRANPVRKITDCTLRHWPPIPVPKSRQCDRNRCVFEYPSFTELNPARTCKSPSPVPQIQRVFHRSARRTAFRRAQPRTTKISRPSESMIGIQPQSQRPLLRLVAIPFHSLIVTACYSLFRTVCGAELLSSNCALTF